MSSFEQTPAAMALEENNVEEKAGPMVKVPKDTATLYEAEKAGEKPEEKPLPDSPAISSGFSDADTAKASRNSDVSDLSSRPRQSWAGSMKRLIGRSSSVMHSEKKFSKQQPSKAPLKISEPVPIPAPLKPKKVTSPVELPAQERPASKLSAKSSPVDPAYDPINQRFRSSKDESIKVSLDPITKPDEPRSFLDLDSSSDEELPVIQRASSVRTGRPNIVRHTSKTATQASQHGERRNAGSPSIEKAEKVLGEPLVNLYDLSPASQKSAEPAMNARADALAKLEGKNDASSDKADPHALILPLPPTPRVNNDKDIHSTTIVVADHPDNAESHDVFVSPQGKLFSIRASVVPSVGDTVPELPSKSVLDGLRSNPMSDTEKSLLHRTISAPPLPSRNPNRRVTIRPTDLVIHHPDHDHKLFKDSIVTTPYPPHLTSPTAEKKEASKTPSGKPTVSVLPPTTSKTDRFPSPTTADEHLFLTLTLSRNPSASTTIEITIPSADATAYDDARLFTTLRATYHSKLLGLTRRAFCSRTLSHATPGTSDMHLDSIDFIAHLTNPSLGSDRKGWLIWLRNQQPLPKRASSLFSSATTPDSAHPPHSAHHSHTGSGTGMSSSWSPSSVPRMPFMRSSTHTLPPLIKLHYRFNLLHIFIAMFFVLMMSVMSTILWVLFGYPGRHAGDSILGADLGLVRASGTWQQDAQLRVLTGLVLGMTVMALGGTGVAGWVAGGWVLL